MIGKLKDDKNFRIAIAVFLVAKLLVFMVGYSAYFLVDENISGRKQVTENEFLNPWAQFDGRAYLDIAKNGYNPEFNNVGNYGWFPLYPLLIKLFAFIGYDLAAFLIPNIFSFLAVTLLYVLVREEYGPEITSKTVFYLTFFPTSYFFSVMYSESIFLFFVLLTFYYGRQEKWLYTGVAGFLASLTRVQGVIVFLPVLYLYMKKYSFDVKKLKPDALFMLLIPLGTAFFLIYMAMLTGDLLAPFHGLALNQKQLTPPWVTLITGQDGILTALTRTDCFSNIVARADCIYHSFNFIIASIFTILAILSWKFLRKDYSIYFLASMGIVLFSNTLQGVTRFVLVMFPAFIMLPLLEEKYPKLRPAVKIAYVLLIIVMIAITARHVNMHLDAYGL